MALTGWLYEQLGRTHAIALDRLAQRLFEWLTTEAGLDPADVAPHLAADIEAGDRRAVQLAFQPFRKGRPGLSWRPFFDLDIFVLT